MPNHLVIVESPAKAKTIEKFLGADYTVRSSYGHVRDLSKDGISVDVENNFEPNYEISADKKKVITELKKLIKDAETVWLATDEDREGEAISWHLAEALNLDVDQTKRIVFKHAHRGVQCYLVDRRRNRRCLFSTHVQNRISWTDLYFIGTNSIQTSQCEMGPGRCGLCHGRR